MVPPIGTLTTNGTFYVIESAKQMVQIIYTNSNGRSGTQGDLGVNIHQIIIMQQWLHSHLQIQISM